MQLHEEFLDTLYCVGLSITLGSIVSIFVLCYWCYSSIIKYLTFESSPVSSITSERRMNVMWVSGRIVIGIDILRDAMLEGKPTDHGIGRRSVVLEAQPTDHNRGLKMI